MGAVGEEVELHHTDPKQLRHKFEHAFVAGHEQAATEAVLKRDHVREADKEKIKYYGIDVEATKKALRSGKTKGRARHLITQLASNTYPMGR